MRFVRNNGYLKRRQRLSRLLVLAGVLGLGGAIFLTFQPSLILAAYAVLIFGFLAFNAGMQQITKWNRSPRPDQMLDDALRRLNDRYTLMHFVQAGKTMLEHVLVFPGGLVVITTREVQGRVQVDGTRWHRQGGRFLQFFGMGGPALGNPGQENERDCEALEAFLEEKGLAGADEVEGFVVFVNPKVELVITSSDRTVVTLEQLVEAVRLLGSEATLSTRERDQIIAELAKGDNVEGPVSLPSRPGGPKGARAA